MRQLVDVLFLSCVLFSDLPCVYGQNVIPGGVQDAVARLSKMHEVWGVKASTPNTSLTIKESSRSGQIIKFRLYANGVPKAGVYTIVSWPVTQKGPIEILKGVTLDESGLAICAGRPGTCGSADKPDDPIDLNVTPIPGEPVRLGLASADGATKTFAKLVPVPLRGEDKGCVVSATLLTAAAEVVLIEGYGFPANSEITTDGDSEGERHRENGKADGDGRYVSAVLPYKQGLVRGTLTINLKSGGCSPSVSIPWGKRD